MSESLCKGCGVRITWAKGPNGAIPLQRIRSLYWIRDGRAVQSDDAAEVYINHFAVCPQAEKFSRKAKP